MNTFGVEYNYDTVVIAVGLHIARSVLESVCMSKLPSVAMLDGVLESARIGDGLSGCASRMVRRAPLVLDAASTFDMHALRMPARSDRCAYHDDLSTLLDHARVRSPRDASFLSYIAAVPAARSLFSSLSQVKILSVMHLDFAIRCVLV